MSRRCLLIAIRLSVLWLLSRGSTKSWVKVTTTTGFNSQCAFTYTQTLTPSESSTALYLTERQIRTSSAAWVFSSKFPWPARNYTIAISDSLELMGDFYMKPSKALQVCVETLVKAFDCLNSRGKETPNLTTWDESVSSRLQYIPVWNDYSLNQLSPDGFMIKKRTKPGQGWINIPGGTRSHGLAYLGGATQGGLAVSLRDFWKRHPTGIDISNAGSDQGVLTIWLYSPGAAPLDLRPYHDEMGEDTYEKQQEGLDITYEDYEAGFNTPHGIARTSEIFLYAFDQTPSADTLATLSKHANEPPILAAGPEYIQETKAAGSYWAVPSTSSSNENSTALESHLDFLVKFYQDQVDYRRWYGFLNYGDLDRKSVV